MVYVVFKYYICIRKTDKEITTLKINHMKNLSKLQTLCDKVNKRYSSGQNDDDQVSAMFKFEKSVKDVRVIIGYDTYQAESVEELERFLKEEKPEIISEKCDASGTEHQYFKIRNYKCNLPIRKY